MAPVISIGSLPCHSLSSMPPSSMFLHTFLILFLVLAIGEAQVPLPFQFGVDAEDVETEPNDDSSSLPIDLPFPMLFYDQFVEVVFQNTNGDITFGSPYSSPYDPDKGIPTDSLPPLIAIYWTDIDTRNGGDSQNKLFMRASTDLEDVDTAADLIHLLGGEASLFNPSAVVVATWDKVEAFKRQIGEHNSFQLAVAYNDQKTYVIFNYGQLEFWESDTSANTVIGFNDDPGVEGTLIGTVGSAADMQALLDGSNVGVMGTYVYGVGEEYSGCGILSLEPVARPTFGPQVGGTVVQIQNLPVCLEDESLKIFCRFTSNVRSIVKPGYLVKEDTVECVSPFIGVESSLKVEYTATTEDELDEDNTEWVRVGNAFQSSSPEPQVVLEGSALPGMFFVGEDIIAEWSGPSLIELALLRLSVGDPDISEEQLKVTLNLLAYDESQDLLVVAETYEVDSSGSTLFTINESSIENYLMPLGGAGDRFATIQVQIEASKVYEGGKTRVGAVKSTGLHAVGLGMDSLAATCPMKTQGCPDLENPPPCPPDYPTANADPDFEDDQACTFPDGARECESLKEISLDLDVYSTCLVFGNLQPDFCMISISDIHRTACSCNFFHKGAAGCVRKLGSQCCYSPAGALITDTNGSGGRADCFAPSRSVYQHFISDVVPFLYCCNVPSGEACYDYYSKRPLISSDGYVVPVPTGRASGDPHLRTFDGVKYDFNGCGEYVAFCASTSGSDLLSLCAPSAARLNSGQDMLSVHLRFVPMLPDHAGTVTEAIALSDPAHRGGQSAIAILPHSTRRVDIYDGSTRIIFPDVATAETSVTLDSGLIIRRTASPTDSERVKVTVLTPSGLRLEATEVGGVWLPSIAPPPGLSGVGLFGIQDNVQANDLTSSTGLQVDIESTTEEIFNKFGQTWMISTPSSSLFAAFENSKQCFQNYFAPTYVPAFETPEITDPDEQFAADAACGGIVSEAERNDCYFDIAVTGLVNIFAAAAEGAVEEETARVAIVTNRRPVMITNAATEDLWVNEIENFAISASDPDAGDDLTMSIDRNDGSLFSLTDYGDGEGVLAFAGTSNAGSYVSWVAVSDGLAVVQFSATIQVNPEVCADGKRSPTESCDDGNLVDGDGCSSTCQIEYCGDGTVNNGDAEECDDGNTENGDGCDANCQKEVCGDGTVNNSGAEECDDGNTVDGDGCSSSCKNEFCGDGTVNNGGKEECDDGNTNDGDGCSSTCLVETILCEDHFFLSVLQAMLGWLFEFLYGHAFCE